MTVDVMLQLGFCCNICQRASQHNRTSTCVTEVGSARSRVAAGSGSDSARSAMQAAVAAPASTGAAPQVDVAHRGAAPRTTRTETGCACTAHFYFKGQILKLFPEAIRGTEPQLQPIAECTALAVSIPFVCKVFDADRPTHPYARP